MLVLLHTWPDLTWFTLPVFVGLLGYATDTFKTIYVQAIFTVTLMNMLAIVAPSGRGFPELRLLNATLGLIVVVVVSLLVMPRGLVPQVEASINRATRGLAAYLKVAIRRLGGALVGADVELLRHCEDEAVAARNSIELQIRPRIRLLRKAYPRVPRRSPGPARFRSHPTWPRPRGGGDQILAPSTTRGVLA